MELKILSRVNNALFERTEVKAAVSSFKATPSRAEVEALLCSELKCKEGSLVIQEIHQPFGNKTVTVTAHVYASPEKAHKTEPNYVFERGKAKPAQKA